MKTKNTEHIPKIQRRLLSALAGFALICSAFAAQAQDLIVNDWTTDEGGTLGLDWVNLRTYIYNNADYGEGAGCYTFDPTQNSVGDTNAGSMYVVAQWPLYSDTNWNNGWNDIQFAFVTGPFDPTNYISFDVDIKVDVANSSPAIGGTDYGAVELIVGNPWQNVVGYATLALTNGWQHFSGSFSGFSDETASDAVIGFISNGSDSLTNTVCYWIGNIVFTAPPTVNTNQPMLSLAKAPPAGLTCLASEAAGTYQRQMVSTVNSNYSWNTSTAVSQTTTYSMTIAACPGGNYPGFESQMFLIPKLGMVTGPSVDWYSANVVDFFVGENPDGTGSGTLQYKVNDPSDWTATLVVSQPCASGPLGKWSLTFNENTNVTITAPDNTSTNFTIPASDASLFQDPLSFYVGTLPNNNANIGQSSTFSQVQVSGSAGSINDTFASLNPSTWVLYAEDPAGVFITTADSKFWVTWPLPDFGFANLYATDNLAKNPAVSQWLSLPAAATGWINVGAAQRLTVINQSTLNAAFGYAPTNCFLGLYHP